MSNFTPVNAGTVHIDATPASAAVELHSEGTELLATNAGPDVVYVAFGGDGVSAAFDAMPLPPGVAFLFGRKEGVSHAAAIAEHGNATVYFSAGSGG